MDTSEMTTRETDLLHAMGMTHPQYRVTLKRREDRSALASGREGFAARHAAPGAKPTSMRLRQCVLAALDHLQRDRMTQCDGVERFVLRQATQNRELGAQRVAIGNGGNHLARRRFDLFHRLCE